MHIKPILNTKAELKKSLLAAQAMDKDDIARALAQIQTMGLGRKVGQEARGTLVGLSTADIHELVLTRSLQSLTNREIEEDETLYDGLGVAYSYDAFDALQDSEGTGAPWGVFLNTAYLITYQQENDSLHLLSPDPLLQLLPRYQALFSPTPLLDWQEKEADSVAVAGLANFFGRHAVCDFSALDTICSDPWCHAEYAWVSAGKCLAYLTASHTATGLFVYPFVTLLP